MYIAISKGKQFPIGGTLKQAMAAIGSYDWGNVQTVSLYNDKKFVGWFNNFSGYWNFQ
jgi:hypothetical protein